MVAASTTALLATLGGGAISGVASARTSPHFVVSRLTTKNYGVLLQSTRTVYTLTPSKVSCTATCLIYWPEVLLPKGITRATAAKGVNAAKLGTIKRAKGRLQVTYAGKPLYWFALDKAPGQVRGNLSDKWGKWSVVVLVKPSGKQKVPTTSTTMSAGGGGGIGF